MMKLVLAFYEKSVDALNKGADMNALIAVPVRERSAVINIQQTPISKVNIRM